MGYADDCSRLLGLLVISLDHVLDPRRLARNINIVRAVLRACFDDGLAVLAVRSDSVDDQPCLLC